jgi:hypothetical protein
MRSGLNYAEKTIPAGVTFLEGKQRSGAKKILGFVPRMPFFIPVAKLPIREEHDTAVT